MYPPRTPRRAKVQTWPPRAATSAWSVGYLGPRAEMTIIRGATCYNVGCCSSLFFPTKEKVQDGRWWQQVTALESRFFIQNVDLAILNLDHKASLALNSAMILGPLGIPNGQVEEGRKICQALPIEVTLRIEGKHLQEIIFQNVIVPCFDHSKYSNMWMGPVNFLNYSFHPSN